MSGAPPSKAAGIAEGYAFQGPTVDLDALLRGGSGARGMDHPAAPVRIPLAALCRHGLVAGAEGTGKTATLRLIAERGESGDTGRGRVFTALGGGGWRTYRSGDHPQPVRDGAAEAASHARSRRCAACSS